MDNGDRESVATVSAGDAGGTSRDDNTGHATAAPAAPREAPATMRRPRRESNRPWASRRADGPSWADDVEQF
jgi:hypothetical protein